MSEVPLSGPGWRNSRSNPLRRGLGQLLVAPNQSISTSTRGYKNAHYNKHSFIKVPRDKRAGGYLPAPARDWYKSYKPSFRIRTFLDS